MVPLAGLANRADRWAILADPGDVRGWMNACLTAKTVRKNAKILPRQAADQAEGKVDFRVEDRAGLRNAPSPAAIGTGQGVISAPASASNKEAHGTARPAIFLKIASPGFSANFLPAGLLMCLKQGLILTLKAVLLTRWLPLKIVSNKAATGLGKNAVLKEESASIKAAPGMALNVVLLTRWIPPKDARGWAATGSGQGVISAPASAPNKEASGMARPAIFLSIIHHPLTKL